MFISIKVHSVIDVITNSSTELFIIESDYRTSLKMITTVIETICREIGHMKWFHEEFRIAYNEEYDTIEIFSWLNLPDEVEYFLDKIQSPCPEDYSPIVGEYA